VVAGAVVVWFWTTVVVCAGVVTVTVFAGAVTVCVLVGAVTVSVRVGVMTVLVFVCVVSSAAVAVPGDDAVVVRSPPFGGERGDVWVRVGVGRLTVPVLV
jgi:hypothetical protein